MTEYCIFQSDAEHEALQAQEILEAAGIGCYVKNLHTQNLFGFGKIFGGMDLIGGSLQLIIDEKNTDRAIEALEPFFSQGDSEENQTGDPEL